MIYEKYSVNGNTFIIFKDDYIQKDYYSELAKRLCDISTGIGADGLIAVQDVDEIEEHDFEWRYYNKDGSKEDFCGNGAIATAYYAHKHGLTNVSFTDNKQGKMVKSKFTFRNDKYLTKAAINNDGYIDISLPHGKIICKVPNICNMDTYLIDTGVLHLVTVFDNMYNYENFINDNIVNVYKKWNKQVNINAVYEHTDETLKMDVNTFEKGVESITESCGSGIAACYLALYADKPENKKYDFIRIVEYPKYNNKSFIGYHDDDNLFHLSTKPQYISSITIEE